MENISKFTERFNECLKYSNKTQRQIAEEACVSKQTISDYKTGRTVPSLDTLYLLCISLDVSADYLLGLTDKF